MSGLFRKKEVPFSQVSNKALRDGRLSLKAKGLYSIIQMYITIPDFILYKNTLIKLSKDGKDSFNTAWKELKDTGYLVQHKMSNGKGVFHYEYELLDETTTDGFSIPGLSIPGKTGIYNNKDLSNKDLSNKEHTGSFNKNSKCFSLYSLKDYFNIEDISDHAYDYIRIFDEYSDKELVFSYEKWSEIIDNLNSKLDVYDNEFIEEIIVAYFNCNFKEHNLYHATLPKILELRQLENNRVS